MNREEILSASQRDKGFDELDQNNYKNAYLAGGLAAFLLAVLYQIYESISGGNWYGYMSICMAQLGISALIFGIRTRKRNFGKLYILSGCICLLSCLFSTVMFFVRDML